VLGTKVYYTFKAWLPLRAVRYGVIYGNPIIVDPNLDAETAKANATAELRQAYIDLAGELKAVLGMKHSEMS
jgi:hypothetical protein